MLNFKFELSVMSRYLCVNVLDIVFLWRVYVNLNGEGELVKGRVFAFVRTEGHLPFGLPLL